MQTRCVGRATLPRQLYAPLCSAGADECVRPYTGCLPGVLHLSHADDLCGSAELLVVAIGLLAVDVEALHQAQSGIELVIDLLEQPDFVVDTGLLQPEARASVNSCQNQADGDGVERLHVQFGELQVILVDPDSSMEFRQEL